MKKVIIMVGISGSGKSTFSKKFIVDNVGWLRISRDELRKSILNVSLKEYWGWDINDINRIENIVTAMQASAINIGIKNDWNLIIDNTNLKLAYINNILNMLKNYDVEISFKFIDCSLQQAIINDYYRVDDKVGEEIIKKQYFDLKNLKQIFDFLTIFKYSEIPQVINVQNESLPKCIIVDIDGTVADKNNRGPFDWSKVGQDTPRQNVISIIESLMIGKYKIIFMSGRDEVCRDITIQWLEKYIKLNEVPILYMRPVKDQRKDSIIKKELYEKYIKDKYYVQMIFDDRDQVVDMWRKELNLPVCQVNYGNF